MSYPEFTPAEAEQTIRRLLADHDLPEPDEIHPRASGGITCLWYDAKLAMVITPDEEPDGDVDAR